MSLGLFLFFTSHLGRCLLLIVPTAHKILSLLGEKVNKLLRPAKSLVFVPRYKHRTQKLVTKLILLLVVKVDLRDTACHFDK